MADLVKTKKKRKSSRKNVAYVPDESGHIIEWIGDHPIGVPHKKEEEDDEHKDGNFIMGQSGG
tara:strand:- start:231 stop:419 length:189 start_codon:yes stop_codon:yes gene_type:complete